MVFRGFNLGFGCTRFKNRASTPRYQVLLRTMQYSIYAVHGFRAGLSLRKEPWTRLCVQVSMNGQIARVQGIQRVGLEIRLPLHSYSRFTAIGKVLGVTGVVLSLDSQMPNLFSFCGLHNVMYCHIFKGSKTKFLKQKI